MATKTCKPLYLTADVTAAQLAMYLRNAGVTGVGATSEAEDVQDGEVMLGGGVHVQIGAGYAVVNYWDGNDLMMGPVRHDACDLIKDIITARKNG